ncbi:MAG: cupin domain-containing protein [Chloroflexota bacterium]|nr:cupin domain-containing protein [Chloroflexota bacterium]
MRVILLDEREYIETPGGNFGLGIATPSRGASEVSVIRQRQRPGGANPAHTHDHEEVMVLLAGEVNVTVGAEPVSLRAGDTVIVPARTPHQIENKGAEPAEWLLVAPAGVRFFHATGEEGSPPWSR